MMDKKYVIDGYSFSSKSEYERAMKERETILYLSANTNMADMKAIYKIYKQAVEKQSFQTIFGLSYMEKLRQRLLGSEFISEDLLEPIPINKAPAPSPVKSIPDSVSAKKVQQYKEAYEKAKSGRIIKNFLIVVLLLVIGVMIFITYNNQYSFFTYFTNYKEDMRNELINEYEDWTNELEERESEVEKREKAFGD